MRDQKRALDDEKRRQQEEYDMMIKEKMNQEQRMQ